MLAEKRVRYIGDAIAAVYAESDAIAREAVAKIRVDYRPLAVVTELDEALKEDALLLHDNGGKRAMSSAGWNRAEEMSNRDLQKRILFWEDDLFTQFCRARLSGT